MKTKFELDNRLLNKIADRAHRLVLDNADGMTYPSTRFWLQAIKEIFKAEGGYDVYIKKSDDNYDHIPVSGNELWCESDTEQHDGSSRIKKVYARRNNRTVKGSRSYRRRISKSKVNRRSNRKD